MNPERAKFRLIYLPFLAIVIGFIACYTFLHWLLFIRFEVVSIKEDVLMLWLPMLLPWIPILIWLRRPLKLLTFKKDNARFGYQMVAWAAIIIPTMIAQSYLVTASGKLSSLNSINELQAKPKTKYYTLKQAYIDKSSAGIYTESVVSGKHNEDLTFHIYIGLPIYGTANDTADKAAAAWMGIEYRKTISNNQGDEKKESEYKAFAEASQKQFEDLDPSQYAYLDRLANSDEHDGFMKAIAESPKHIAGADVILKPINEPFTQRNGQKLPYTLMSLGIGALIWLIMIMIPKLDQSELEDYLDGRPEKENDLKDMVAIVVPRQGFFATPIIFDLNVLVFIIMMFAGLGVVSFRAEDLLQWGADYRPATTNGEWWRLLTNIFLHGGIMHLIANMVGLIFIGMFLEPILGTKRFTLLYLVTGILASVASVWWHPNTVSVGASGAIFGMFGAFLALLLTGIFPPDFKRQFLVTVSIFIGYNLLMGLTGGIDNAAHIGGLISGFILGFAFYPSLKARISANRVKAELQELQEESK